MSDSINDLYLKYANAVSPIQESDRYFRYLFESISNGENSISHNRQLLHKVVDQEWLDIIEENIPAIFEVIEKPRRFVTTSEEVVPVSLAKKISSDSIRHLASHTEFINSDVEEEIQPTKILNVTVEETYDLYENRFIYHLIDRLAAFIDKRTDMIFWSTGDEVNNVFTLQSHIDDAYEQIDYKVEMHIKSQQSPVENDNDNMDVFMRIDRVKRLVSMLKKSSFCELLAGCAKVRSPIQRTNLIMKEHNYRKCYTLWQFIESYDSLGYVIQSSSSALEYDQEYQTQLYSMFVQNYSLFKTILDPDQRDVEKTISTKRRFKKPRFIKEIKEELVLDKDIPEVEIRRVFVEEVTKAQIEAEEALTKQLEENKKITGELKLAQSEARDAKLQAESAMYEMQNALARADEAYSLQTAAENALQKAEYDAAMAIQAKQNAEAKASDMEMSMNQAKKDFEDSEKRRKTNEKELKELRSKEAEAVQTVAALREELKQLGIEKDEALAKASEEIAKRNQLEIERIISEKDAEIAAAVDAAEKDKQNAVKKIKDEKNELISKINISKDLAIKRIESDKNRQIDDIISANSEEIRKINEEKEALINSIREEALAEIEGEKQRLHDELLIQQALMQEEMQQIIEASRTEVAAYKAAAEANRLTSFISASINARRKEGLLEEAIGKLSRKNDKTEAPVEKNDK